MPFKSKAQRRFMYANDKKMAREFEKKTPKGKKLPERASGKHMGSEKRKQELIKKHGLSKGLKLYAAECRAKAGKSKQAG